MFGQKQREIESLQASVTIWKNNAESMRKARDAKASELSALQEAFRNGLEIKEALKVELAETINQNRDYEAHIETLDYALSESKGLNQALEDENKDLVRQVDLYRALLSSVRINVTLPARKR